MSVSRRSIMQLGLAAATGALLVGLGAAQAQDRELQVGISGAISSVDPHYAVLSSNQALSRHFFEGLTTRDGNFRPQPMLAESWKSIDPLTWEFKLREGVKFTDGSALDAADVVASFERAPNVENSPSSFRTYTNRIANVVAVDDLTVRFETTTPNPLLPMELTQVMIIPSELKSAKTAEFNSGEAMIGTGPYVMTKYVPGSVVEMVRNEDYWGEKEPWSRVVMRIVSNNASRTAGLLSGDLDVIDNIAPTDIPVIEASGKNSVVNIESNRLIYLMLDHFAHSSPYITDNSGKPLEKNPLTDLRVRQALSMSINRDGLTERLLSGQGIPASQFVADKFTAAPDLDVTPYDTEAAKALLAEAGYPDGFKITLHGPNDRYLNDGAVLQAVAQMFSRIGVTAQTELAPWVTFRPHVSNNDFSVALFGWASNTGETGPTMYAILGTQDAQLGRGVPNGGRYSNADFDEKVATALGTIDDDERARLLKEATDIAMNDVALIPLYYPMVSWATKKDITYAGSADQFTTAMDARPVN